MTPATVADVFAQARGPLLLDFDGPICRLFTGNSAAAVAADLRALLAHADASLPEWLTAQNDPLEVLRWAGQQERHEWTVTVEDALRAAELEASNTAEPTPHAAEVIHAARSAERAVAIVSNNSTPAIENYLTRHDLNEHVRVILGRPYTDPARMKPDPYSIHQAMHALSAKPGECILIGDSVNDITAAHAAGVRVIGYANKPGKGARLSGSNAIIANLYEITDSFA